jgi:hypothetical protein
MKKKFGIKIAKEREKREKTLQQKPRRLPQKNFLRDKRGLFLTLHTYKYRVNFDMFININIDS